MWDNLQEIFTTLKKNRLRTFLTGFSMAWGVFMLIVLLGSGNGIRNGILFNFGDQASNVMTLWPGTTAKAYDGLQAGRNIKLEKSDVPYLEHEFSGTVSSLSPLHSRYVEHFSYGQDYLSGRLMGVNTHYASVEVVHVYPGEGRFINELDIKLARKVLVMHSRTAELLFKDVEPIGKYVTVDNVMYRVVGIYHDENTSQNPNNLIPITTYESIYNAHDSYTQMSMILDGLETEEANNQFDERVRASLGRKHRYAADDQSALYLYNRTTEFLQFKGIFNGITLFVWIIGIGTLIAGVVGISNIMLITVKERTREFGIRKALGARPGEILRLILTECLCITAFFGYLGMLLGIVVIEVMNKLVGTPEAPSTQETMTIFTNPTVEPGIIIAATLVLIIAGLLAGYFPARKAVKVKPIEALRYE